MDRFIEELRPMFYSTKIRLKSNMDRFIEAEIDSLKAEKQGLKSNMDRFIEILSAICQLIIDL